MHLLVTQHTYTQTYSTKHAYIHIIYVQGAHNKFPDSFRMDTFIDSTHMEL